MAPATAFVWDLRVPGGYINKDNLITRKRLLCVAARFIGEEDMSFYAEWLPGGRAAMLEGIWNLLDTADAVVTFNGISADEPWVNTEFIIDGMKPPSPSKPIDLYRAIKKRFNFMSSSLAYSTSLLGVRTARCPYPRTSRGTLRTRTRRTLRTAPTLTLRRASSASSGSFSARCRITST
jgi:hypothetical protein